jgi:hypothetical protein
MQTSENEQRESREQQRHGSKGRALEARESLPLERAEMADRRKRKEKAATLFHPGDYESYIVIIGILSV